jgi:hypothetical protein
MRPTNYRTHDFHLFGQDIAIGGMAGPHQNADKDGALSGLREAGNTVLIGLHETDFSADAARNGLEYYHIPMSENGSNPPDVYDKIYDIVKKATAEGKGVTIHCGAGDGRTGTALACLKLRELLEKSAAKNLWTLDETPAVCDTVHATSVHDHDIPCTPLVKTAIREIRTARTAPDASGSHSVETENEVRTLVVYERHLREILKEELTAQQEHTVAPQRSSTAAMALGLAKSVAEAREQLKGSTVDRDKDEVEKRAVEPDAQSDEPGGEEPTPAP